jgi:hypothetical protein
MHKWVHYINMDLQGVALGVMDRIYLAQNRDR